MSELDGWAERRRIAEQARGERAWSLWGPYLAERQWGTVREDYSRDGNAWRSLPHEEARSRAYRWVRTGWRGSATSVRRCACPSPCGTAATTS